MKRQYFFLYAMVVFFTVCPKKALAEFNFTPSIMVREAYNDNIDLTNDNKTSDFITTIQPGATLDYSSTLLSLSIAYRLSSLFYAENSENNENIHNANASVMMSPIRDILFLNITDVYTRQIIDQRKQTGTDNYTTNQTDSNQFVFYPYLELPRSGSLKVRLGASYEDMWYRSDEGDSTKKYTALASVTKVFSERHSVKLAYTYLSDRPTISEDYDRQDVSVTISSKNDYGFTFEGTAGIAEIDYESDAYGETSSFVGNIRLRYAPLGGRLSMDTGYAEDFSDSVGAGLANTKAADLNVRYGESIKVTAGVFWANEKYEQEEREDRSHGGKVGLSLPLSSNITAKMDGSYTRYKFLPEEEEADRYTGLASIEYLLRKLSLMVGYVYNYNDSNIETNDYKNNIAYIQARYTF